MPRQKFAIIKSGPLILEVFMAEENITAPTGMNENELNTVRDILFGAKTREHEQRFDDLRQLWASSLEELALNFASDWNPSRRTVRNKFATFSRKSRSSMHRGKNEP